MVPPAYWLPLRVEAEMLMGLSEVSGDFLTLYVSGIERAVEGQLWNLVANRSPQQPLRLYPSHDETRSSGWSGTEQPFDFEGLSA